MNAQNFQHISVLAAEVLQYLNLQSGDFAADLTAGGGGHLEQIAKAVGPSGKVVAFDRDERALQDDAAGGVAKKYADRIQLIHAPFAQIEEILQNDAIARSALARRSNPESCHFRGNGNTEREPVIPVETGIHKNVILAEARIVANTNNPNDSDFHQNDKHHASLAMRLNALLCDLGVSSPQLDIPERGFSFKADGPLDMRMDQSRGKSAYDLIKDLKEDQLADILFQFGDERLSRRIARVIKAQWPIANSTVALAELIAKCYPKKYHRIHPATRSFQALRIAVNGELDELKQLLISLPHIMNTGGRVVFISFHSLEDRIIKHHFRDNKDQWKTLTKKPVCASAQELEQNPRSRSAKLRAYEFIGN